MQWRPCSCCPDETYKMHKDASDLATGALLYQTGATRDELRPIAYESRKLLGVRSMQRTAICRPGLSAQGIVLNTQMGSRRQVGN